MYNDLIVEDRSQQGLNDLALDIDWGSVALEAVANCINRSLDERRLLVSAIFLGAVVAQDRKVRVRYQLPDAVERRRRQLDTRSLGCQLQWVKDDLGVWKLGVVFLDGLERLLYGLRQLLVSLCLLGSSNGIQRGYHKL